MNDYNQIIEWLNQAKEDYLKDREPLTHINLALIKLIALESEQNYQASEMGKEYLLGKKEKNVLDTMLEDTFNLQRGVK
jgi:hypothetical protein